MNNKIIEKIKKLLSLSNNNPSSKEAISASMKAQELLAKYHLKLTEIEDNEPEEILTEFVDIGKGEKWKYSLASIVSRNFRCKEYWMGRSTLCFYGYDTDIKVASETFKYLFKSGKKLAIKVRNRVQSRGLSTKGVYNTYLVGYLAGIADSLDKQCVALMLVTPKEVSDSYAEMSKTFGKLNGHLNTTSYNDAVMMSEIYNEGIVDGRSMLSRRRIES